MTSPQESIQLAIQHHKAGRYEEAVACYRQAIHKESGSAPVHTWLSDALARLGRWDEATIAARQAVALDPASPDAHNALGTVLARQQNLPEAAACFGKAVALRPGLAEAHHNLGNVLREMGRLEEAIESYRAALAIRPNLASSYCALGNCLRGLRRLDEAAVAFQNALAIRPDYAQVWLELGDLHVDRAEPDQAIAYCQNAIRFKPDMAEAYATWASAALRQGEAVQAVDLCRQALSIRGDCVQAHDVGLYAMLLSPKYMPQAVYEAHRRYADQYETPLKSSWPAHANARDPARKLRVGYVSPDFRFHSVAFFFEPLLAHHDRDHFEIFCYDNNAVALRDATTQRLSGHVDHWISCHELSDAQLAERITADGIDILIDLAGHTRGNRLRAFAHKPAPVQVTYLGYPTTTGLSAMDYRLTSWDVDPEGSDATYTERLYRLPRAPWCYRPPAEPLDTDAGPRAHDRAGITFGSMNNTAKVSPETVAAWGEILRAIPDSRLMMTTVPEGSARTSLMRRFADNGVHPDRITLHGKLPIEQFRALEHEIDIALDPFPYNGTTTTCETLSMGIPVITLIGNASVSRSGYALLKAIGLLELCANTQAEYVNIAAGLANDRARLAELHRTLRRRFERSPLRDESGFTRDVEDAYRDMWRRWCVSMS